MLIICGSIPILSQSTKSNQQKLTLQEAINSIEARSDYIFNYDPALIKTYTYTGDLDLTKLDTFLKEFLYDSPLQYEIDGQTILVYQPNPEVYRICGTLRDALSKEPLVGANITLIDSTIGTQTDLSGYFEFDCTAYKNQEVEMSYLGYTSIKFTLQEILYGSCPTWDMDINQDLFSGDIVISDYLLDGIDQGDDYNGFSLDFDQLSKNHSTVEHDILKTAQLLPGINSIDDSATNLQIRGSNPGQNLILWEGAPIYNAGHIFGMISAINPFSVENVRIYKGAHDPKYDNRVGGIMDIALSDDVSSEFHGSVGTTLTEFHTNLSIPIIKDKVKLELAGRQSLNWIYNSPTLQSYTDKVFQFSIIEDKSSFSVPLTTEQTLGYQDWNTKILYRPTDKLSINAGFYRNAQDFSYRIWLGEDSFLLQDEIDLMTQIVRLETELAITDKWSSNLSLYQSSYANDYSKRELENEEIVYNDEQINRIKERSVSVTNAIKLGTNLKLNVGYEHNIKEVALDLGSTVQFDSDFVPLENEEASFHNLFQSLKYTFGKLQVDVGNRTSYYQELGKWFHSPRFNTRYAINDHLTLKADAGVYHQFISQLTNLGGNQIKVDNPLWLLNSSGESLSQKAQKIAIGLVFQKGKWLFDLDGYYNHIDNINTVVPQLDIIRELGGFSKGSSTVIGVDVLLKKRWSNGFNTWLSYTLGIAEYQFTDFSEASFFAPNDIRHNFSFVTSYSHKGLQLSMNTNYNSGLPYSQAVLTLNEDDPNAEAPFLYYTQYESLNSERLLYYLRLDLNASYRFAFKPIKGSQIELSCSLVNALDRTNTVAREYFVDYSDDTEIYNLASIEKALLGRTPLILLRLYW